MTTFTVGGVPLPGDVFTVTMNTKNITYTEGNALTPADVTAGLQTLLTASSVPEFASVTWTNPTSTTIVGTATTAGTPFTATKTLTPANVAPPVLNAPTLTSGGSLSSGQQYFYELTCTNSNGETTASNEVNATPSGGNLSVVLTWSVVPGATGYKLYRGTSTGAENVLVTTVGSGSTVTFTDTGATTTSHSPPVSNTAASTATFSVATVAGQGPNDWSVAANWSTGSVPASSDTVYITQTSSSILYGLAQSAVTLTAMYIDSTFTGKIGLPIYNPLGYYEYLPTSLAISATTLQIGAGSGSGSSLIRINLGSNASTPTIFSTGSSATQGIPAVQLLGSSIGTLTIQQGSVGLATDPGSTTTVTTVYIGYQNSQATDVTLYLGSGTTATTITQDGGTVNSFVGCTTWNLNGGGTASITAGNITTLTINSGLVNYQGGGTLSTVTVGANNASLIMAKNPNTRTITNMTIYPTGTYTDSGKTTTWTNPIAVKAPLADVTLDIGTTYTLQYS